MAPLRPMSGKLGSCGNDFSMKPTANPPTPCAMNRLDAPEPPMPPDERRRRGLERLRRVIPPLRRRRAGAAAGTVTMVVPPDFLTAAVRLRRAMVGLG